MTESIERCLRTDALVRGDGLALAGALPAGCCDLIYLDPPFGTGARRRPLRGRGGRFRRVEAEGFADPRPERASLSGWIEALLIEGARLLRPGGALFLHLDWRSAHHARLALERIFGPESFLNEIIWHYATGGIPSAWFARKHDTILYFRNGPGHTFHRLTERKRLAHRMSRRGVEEFREGEDWYRYRALDDVWEIPWLTQDARERTGYPTQKPLALLVRILLAATDPGMRVADFCCGSGTTAVAARGLGRRWIACDPSAEAIRVAHARLDSMRPEDSEIRRAVASAVQPHPEIQSCPAAILAPYRVVDWPIMK